jgi:hypothetical protein
VQDEQPPQLDERVRMVLNPQGDVRLPGLAMRGNHQDRRRLAPADVPTRAFGGVERRQ